LRTNRKGGLEKGKNKAVLKRKEWGGEAALGQIPGPTGGTQKEGWPEQRREGRHHKLNGGQVAVEGKKGSGT